MTWIWIAFTALILGLLALDLGVFHRRPHAIRAGEALGWTAFGVAPVDAILDVDRPDERCQRLRPLLRPLRLRPLRQPDALPRSDSLETTA